MKEKHKQAHMNAALGYAECSTARRLKVGAVIVKDDSIISIGYNGTPPGWDNNCEDLIDDFDTDGNYLGQRLKTKPEVIHAEANAIDKLARKRGDADGAAMFCTHAPCFPCALRIFGAGIRELYYKDVYRSIEGVEFLAKAGVKVEKFDV